MPVDSVHPEYAARQEQWGRCNDCYAGTDAIKGAGTKYLSMLSKQTDDQYAAYKKRALFYGATGRTVEGIVGAIMRKDPVFELPGKLPDLEKDITFTGVALREFTKLLVKQQFLTARSGVLIDRRPTGDTRPYFSLYSAQNIINWREEAGELVLVVLQETSYEPDAEDKYEWKKVERFRELKLEEGKYVQTVHTRQEKTQQDFTTDDITPVHAGKPLDHIPFVFISPEGLNLKIQKPPILDLVDVNLSHYMSSADLEHGRHFTALPTIYFTGVSKSDLGDAVHIGSGKAAVLPPPEARAGIIEFKGEGLGALENALNDKEAMMAKLGARLLEDQRKGVEAAETARIHAKGEMSVAMGITLSVSDGLQKAFQLMAKWEGQSEDAVKVDLNKDFIDVHLDPQTLTALIAARQAGEISQDTFLYNLQRGEMLPPDITIEDELDKLKLTAGTEGLEDD